jgi:hypothetical protein
MRQGTLRTRTPQAADFKRLDPPDLESRHTTLPRDRRLKTDDCRLMTVD